ncbi:MAG: hypothetical protein KIH65_003030 [Candidatus Uhrbacteria bacterium]|nr:hypothetical protein [Candidatus Uhrbacteria bacterium]
MEAFIQGIGNWLVSTFGIFGIFILLVLIFFWWVILIVAILAIFFALDFFIRVYEYARGRRETIFDPSSVSSGYYGYTGTASSSDDCDSGGNNDSPGDYGPTPGYGGTI